MIMTKRQICYPFDSLQYITIYPLHEDNNDNWDLAGLARAAAVTGKLIRPP